MAIQHEQTHQKPPPTLDEVVLRVERLETGLADFAELMDGFGKRHTTIPAVRSIKADVAERRRVYDEARMTRELEDSLNERRARGL